MESRQTYAQLEFIKRRNSAGMWDSPRIRHHHSELIPVEIGLADLREKTSPKYRIETEL